MLLQQHRPPGRMIEGSLGKMPTTRVRCYSSGEDGVWISSLPRSSRLGLQMLRKLSLGTLLGLLMAVSPRNGGKLPLDQLLQAISGILPPALLPFGRQARSSAAV